MMEHELSPSMTSDQHFLRDKTVVTTAVKAAKLVKGDVVVEIGCGHGRSHH